MRTILCLLALGAAALLSSCATTNEPAAPLVNTPMGVPHTF